MHSRQATDLGRYKVFGLLLKTMQPGSPKSSSLHHGRFCRHTYYSNLSANPCKLIFQHEHSGSQLALSNARTSNAESTTRKVASHLNFIKRAMPPQVSLRKSTHGVSSLPPHRIPMNSQKLPSLPPSTQLPSIHTTQ